MSDLVLSARPGATFHIVNQGCKVNRVEADTVGARLIELGWKPEAEDAADLVVVNTCTVTGEADKKARKAVRHALKAAPGARVIVTGCAVAIDEEAYSKLGPAVEVVQRAHLLAALEDELRQKAASGLSSPEAPPLPVRIGEGFRTRVNIKVQDGCDRACTFCIVHVARGPARSTPREEVLAEADAHLIRGAKELVLTGIDLGSYRNKGAGLADLVSELLELADKRCPAGQLPARVRASSLEPVTVDDAFLSLLARNDGRLCRHLHLPLQSGSSKVLGQMARPYTASDFEQLAALLYERVPSLSLTTDIICGFPGETEDDFAETLELARRCRFSKIHVFPYSKRAGTPAAIRDDQVDERVKAQRSLTLRRLSDELRASDLKRRRHTTELAIVEGERALTESYHEIAPPKGALPGTLLAVTL